MAQITLTEAQIQQIRSDSISTRMLTDEQVVKIASKLNKVINLPFLSEDKELTVFVKLVHRFDQVLYNILPNEYYSLINSAVDGITPDEAKVLTRRLEPAINNLINIPFLSEKQEGLLISFCLSCITTAMIKGVKL